MGAERVKMANLALRFLLELCVLAAVGYWGWQAGRGVVGKLGLGIGAPLLVAVVWGKFGSPQASVPLTGPLHLLLELVLFGSGPVALYAAGEPARAKALALAILSNRLLMLLWRQ